MGRKYRLNEGERMTTYFDAAEIALAKKRVVIIAGVVDESMLAVLTFRLRHLAIASSKPITLYFSSCGGVITAGLGVYDLIRDVAKKCPVHVVASGHCISMALIVLQAATKRLSLPNTTFMMHELSNAAGGGRLSETREQQEQGERLQNLLDAIVHDRSGQDMKKLRKMIERHDLYMTPEEALKYHLIDSIIEA